MYPFWPNGIFDESSLHAEKREKTQILEAIEAVDSLEKKNFIVQMFQLKYIREIRDMIKTHLYK